MKMVTEIKKNWFKRHWIISIILGLIVLLIISAVMSPEGPEQSKETSEPEQVRYNLGETFIVDDVAFKINGVSTKLEIGEYILDSFFGEKADGIFYIVDLTLENKAQESKNIFIERFKIIDNQGRKFDYDIGAEIYYDEKDAITFGQQLQPGLPISGVKIFDLPTSAEGLKLEITCCGFMSETAQVDLGR